MRPTISFNSFPLVSYFVLITTFIFLPSPRLMGQSDHSIELIDQAVEGFMQHVGATAGTVAISRDGHLLYAKGYGHVDSKGKVGTKPESMIRIASATKPITATICQKLIASGELELETRIYDLLKIEPHGGQLSDERIKDITVGHLLEHKGGWDRTDMINPMYELSQVRSELGLKRDLTKKDIVRYMWTQPLQSDPGSERVYSNFGYMLLGLAIEKVRGQSYATALQQLIADDLGVDDFVISSKLARNRNPREVHYRVENRLDMTLRDSSSGIATSATTLCKFMDHYWLDGLLRDGPRHMFFYHYGTHPHTTSVVISQRMDGLNYAILLNCRREENFNEDNEAIRLRFDEVLDEVVFQ